MAGTPIRELFARIFFQTDKQSVNRVNRASKDILGNLAKFAGILGVGVGAKAFYDMANSAEQAEARVVALFDGSQKLRGGLDTARNAVDDVRRSIRELSPEAADILKAKEADEIISEYFRQFQSTSESNLQRFKVFLKAAIEGSLREGVSPLEAFASILDTAMSGDLSQMARLLGISAEEAGRFAVATGLIQEAAGQFGFVAIETNAQRIQELLERRQGSFNDFLKTGEADIVATTRRTTASLTDAFEKMSRRILDALEKPLNKLSDFVDKLTEGKGIVESTLSIAGVDTEAARQAQEIADAARPASAEVRSAEVNGLVDLFKMMFAPILEGFGSVDGPETPEMRAQRISNSLPFPFNQRKDRTVVIENVNLTVSEAGNVAAELQKQLLDARTTFTPEETTP